MPSDMDKPVAAAAVPPESRLAGRPVQVNKTTVPVEESGNASDFLPDPRYFLKYGVRFAGPGRAVRDGSAHGQETRAAGLLFRTVEAWTESERRVGNRVSLDQEPSAIGRPKRLERETTQDAVRDHD